jgi:hypothetical protein
MVGTPILTDGVMEAKMKQTEYTKGWGHAGWLLVIMTLIMFLSFFLVGTCNAQVQTQHLSVIAKKKTSEPAGNPGPAPTFVDNSVISASGYNAAPTIPSGVAVNDIIFIHVTDVQNTGGVSTPSGYTLADSATHSGFYSAPNSYKMYLFWKRATASDTGSVTVTRASANGTRAIFSLISLWRGAEETGTPYESLTLTEGSYASSEWYSASITPSIDSCRIISFCYMPDNTGINLLAGGNYVEDFEETDATATDGSFACDSFAQGTAANEPQRTGTLGATDYTMSFTLALKPE